MSFKASLFELFNRADTITVDFYEVDYAGDCGTDVNGNPVIRLTYDEEDYYFSDQEVSVLEGECFAQAADMGDDHGSKSGHRLRFEVSRPLTEADL